MFHKSIASSARVLAEFVNASSYKTLDEVRVARSLFALLLSGVDIQTCNLSISLNNLMVSQRADGGWVDVEETSWAIAVILNTYGPMEPRVQSGFEWLRKLRRTGGGWGRHYRDEGKLPITGLIAAILPSIFSPEDLKWLVNEWERDFRGAVRLAYKAGFFLLALPSDDESKLVTETLAHLVEDQNDDGGFGPWRDHPIGSDPWSTGVVLWGLSRWVDKVDRAILHRALAWLERTQLPSGYWPYHYLDDGTSIALIGAVAALKALVLRPSN